MDIRIGVTDNPQPIVLQLTDDGWTELARLDPHRSWTTRTPLQGALGGRLALRWAVFASSTAENAQNSRVGPTRLGRYPVTEGEIEKSGAEDSSRLTPVTTA